MTAANDYGLGHGFVVYVRHEDDQGIGAGGIFGVYERRASADRKADAINKRISASESSEVAWAYVVPLEWANTPADKIVETAIRV